MRRYRTAVATNTGADGRADTGKNSTADDGIPVAMAPAAPGVQADGEEQGGMEEDA